MPDARAVRKAYEDGVEAPVRSATERIAKARFAALGTSVYPDATFTLRLNYGTVQGWNENGKPVEPFTRLSRAFERATGADPFRIPDSWQRVKDKLDMNTPFNLSTNNDIVGGNSGSPLINAKAEIVGLHVRRQHPLDLGRVLVRHGEEPRGRRAPGDHAGGDVEGLRGRCVAGGANEVIDRGLAPLLSSGRCLAPSDRRLEPDPFLQAFLVLARLPRILATTSKRMRISSSTTSVPMATLNGFNPSSDCLSGNSPLRHEHAVLALQRHRHAHECAPGP